MNLGEKLQANWDAANAAMSDAEQRKINQDRRLWEANNKKVLAVIEEVVAKIVNAIEDGKPLKPVKLPKFEPFDVFKWKNHKIVGVEMAKAEFEKHPHNTALISFFEWADKNGLVGKYAYDHDGFGMESWYVATVEPKRA